MQGSTATTFDRRQFQRRPDTVYIEVHVGAYRETLASRDLSVGGIFLETRNKASLPVQTIVCLTEEGQETVLGRVVWVAEDGMGVEFIGRPPRCCQSDTPDK